MTTYLVLSHDQTIGERTADRIYGYLERLTDKGLIGIISSGEVWNENQFKRRFGEKNQELIEELKKQGIQYNQARPYFVIRADVKEEISKEILEQIKKDMV